MNLSSLEGMLHPDALAQGTDAVNQAAPAQVDAHRGLLDEAFSMLQQQGENPQEIAQQAGASSTSPTEMNAEDMVKTTLAFARSHPQLVETLAAKYPAAQPVLNSVLGSAANTESPNSSLFGGLLSRITGG